MFKHFGSSAFYKQFDPAQYVERVKLRALLIEVAFKAGFEVYMDLDSQLKLHRKDGKIIEFANRGGFSDDGYHLYSIRQWAEYNQNTPIGEMKNLYDRTTMTSGGNEETYGSYCIYHVQGETSEMVNSLKELICEVEKLFKDDIRDYKLEKFINEH
jgi:myo-inositol-hexaphosphate 3-phosphohydrolase